MTVKDRIDKIVEELITEAQKKGGNPRIPREHYSNILKNDWRTYVQALENYLEERIQKVASGKKAGTTQA